jgi:hypothetical protein
LDDRVTILGLAGQTALLGVAAAFTPSLFALQILVCGGDPWKRRALAVGIGGGAAFVIVGGLMFVGFAQLPTLPGGGGDVDAVLRLLGGAILVAAAVLLFRPHPGLEHRVESDIEGYVARASTWLFLGIAFALSIKDLSSFVVLAPALHDIAVADTDVIIKAVLLVELYALALSPVLAPPLARLVFGHRADAAFGKVYAFTMSHQFQLVGGMAAVIAVYLIASGLALLF